MEWEGVTGYVTLYSITVVIDGQETITDRVTNRSAITTKTLTISAIIIARIPTAQPSY